MALRFPLRSGRLLVRPFEETDAMAAHALYGDAEVMRYVGDGSAATPEQSAQMVEDYRRHQREHGFAFWAVIDRGTGELIGDAGLEVTRHGTEIGYTLARPWWGQGLATEAARLCVDAAFGALGLTRLVALVDAENPASARVLGKLGFHLDTDTEADLEAGRAGRPEGTVIAYGRPHLRYVLVRPARVRPRS